MKMKKGFSLIEIGIVMIIIGILIAAVMKGKDVIKSAEIKQHNQTFLNKWVSVATTHYDKTGYNITGSSTSSSMTAAQGFGEDNESGVDVYGCSKLKSDAKKAGINLSTVISTNTGSPCTKIISGEFSGDVTVAVGFESLLVNTSEETNTTRNVVLFFNVPGDIALAFDRLVDGMADTDSGKVIALQSYTTPQTKTSMADDNLTTDSNGTVSISPDDMNASKLYTVGVILEH